MSRKSEPKPTLSVKAGDSQKRPDPNSTDGAATPHCVKSGGNQYRHCSRMAGRNYGQGKSGGVSFCQYILLRFSSTVFSSLLRSSVHLSYVLLSTCLVLWSSLGLWPSLVLWPSGPVSSSSPVLSSGPVLLSSLVKSCSLVQSYPLV